MTKEEIIEALKQMSNLERLEIIEFTSQLMREEEIEAIKARSQARSIASAVIDYMLPKKVYEEVEITEGVTANLEYNSAEAQALKRIASPISNDEWIVVDEVGQEIDMDAVKEKFKQRGYKSKISATQASKSGK